MYNVSPSMYLSYWNWVSKDSVLSREFYLTKTPRRALLNSFCILGISHEFQQLKDQDNDWIYAAKGCINESPGHLAMEQFVS